MESHEALSTVTLIVSFMVALVFAGIHFWAPQLHKWIYSSNEEKITCFTGGLAIAYVFCTLLPEVEHLEESLGGHYYVLGGFLLFYALQRLAWSIEQQSQNRQSFSYFSIEIGYKAVYNFSIIYAIPEEFEAGKDGIILYIIAMGLHLLNDDYTLTKNHGHLFRQWGRYILVGSIGFGFLTDIFRPVSPIVADILLAALSGALVFNIFKQEVPEVDRVIAKNSYFNLFFLGVATYLVLGFGSWLIELYPIILIFIKCDDFIA